VNAPAKIAASRDRYIPIVKNRLPTCDGQALVHRCSILLLGDQASASMRRCSEEAYGILAEVSRLAALYAYASLPIAELSELRHRLGMLTTCASGLEGFAFRLAYPGGTNEGG
jgi:hypothetical protein